MTTALYTKQQAAQIFQVSTRTIERMTKANELRPVRIGRLVRFQGTELTRTSSQSKVCTQ
jgi:excisionase family DNA binding protein